MNRKIIYALIATVFSYVQASSSESDASSVSESVESIDNSPRPPCIECPPTKMKLIHCKKRRTLSLTQRTCYSCPEYKCIKTKYIEGDAAKFCKKILPTCKRGCRKNETCFVSVQTRYKCSEANCIPRFLNRDMVIDTDFRK